MTGTAAPLARRAGSGRVSWFVVPAVLTMLGLGTWQLERLSWKEDLIQRVTARMAAPAVALPATVTDADALDLRPVTVTGRFREDHTLLKIARPRQGQVGYEALVPLERTDGDPVLVNRGWVPLDWHRPQTATEGAMVTVRGIARLPAAPGWLTPDNVPGDAVWRRVDLAAMAAAAGVAHFAPVVVEALPVPGGVLAGIEPQLDLPNNHLQYAITWYSLAVTLMVIYGLHRRRSSTP